MKKLVLMLGLIAMSSPAFSANWVKYDVTDNDGTSYYYDQDSVKIKTLGNGTKYIEMWEKRDYSTPQLQTIYPSNCNQYLTTNCNQYYQQMKIKNVYDCWNNKHDYLYGVVYDSDGNVVFSEDVSSTTSLHSSNTWREIIPDTVGEGKLKQLCSAYRSHLK